MTDGDPDHAAPPAAPVRRGHQHASKALERVKGIPPDLQGEYRALAQNFPAMVRQSGLAPVLGTLQSRSIEDGRKTSHGLYLDDLAHMLARGDGSSLHQSAIHSPMSEYASMTREALAAADWLQRFSQSFPTGKAAAQAETTAAR